MWPGSAYLARRSATKHHSPSDPREEHTSTVPYGTPHPSHSTMVGFINRLHETYALPYATAASLRTNPRRNTLTQGYLMHTRGMLGLMWLSNTSWVVDIFKGMIVVGCPRCLSRCRLLHFRGHQALFPLWLFVEVMVCDSCLAVFHRIRLLDILLPWGWLPEDDEEDELLSEPCKADRNASASQPVNSRKNILPAAKSHPAAPLR